MSQNTWKKLEHMDPGLLKLEIQIKQSAWEEIAQEFYFFKEFVETIRQSLLRIERTSYEKVRELIKRADKEGLFWQQSKSPNVLDLIYYKAEQQVIDSLRTVLHELFEDHPTLNLKEEE